jgi:hypothetical protein
VPDLRDPVALKRLLSPLLLGIKGVSGLGVPSGTLTVYLESDDEDVRRRVKEVIAKTAPDAVPEFVITGAFQAR